MAQNSKPTIRKQEYKAYTDEDRMVWKTLFERQIANLEKFACREYLQGIRNVGFSADRIPDFDEVKERFQSTTGWSLHVVPGIIPVEEFFPLLNVKSFSASTWLRKMSQLDYIEEPDMFHDVFGHVPLLSIETFSEFVTGLSRLAMENLHDAEAMEMIGRIYWFTLEFGLICQDGELKVYGAGLCSSFGETIHAIQGERRINEFDIAEIMRTPFQNDRIQDLYFLIESFDQLFNSLDEIRSILQEVRMRSIVV